EQGVPLDEIVEGLCERDAGRALVAVAERIGAGQDPRQLARDLIEHLRNTFLATMAPRVAGLPDDELTRLGDQARRLGAPATVRAMETLGEALVDMPTRDERTLAWGDRVLGTLSPRAKALYKSGRFTEVEGTAAVYALPNKVHRDRCERVRDDVEAALATEFGRPVPLRLVIDEEPSGPPPEPVDEVTIDVEEVREATPAAVTSPIDHVMQAFEGAEVVED